MYDVVIVGSGYGGSAVAANVAGHGRVLMLERGRAWSPGMFPRTLAGTARAYLTRSNPFGLWGMRLGHGTGNAFASGLGGASLVNYGITTKPDSHVFEDWPVSEAELAPFFERALSVLSPSALPAERRRADRGLIEALEPDRCTDIENTVDWATCTECGQCVPGCNEGAKRSLDKTYLPRAVAAGLEVRSGWTARWVRPLADGSVELIVSPTDRPGDLEAMRARHLVLAAGTFGTLDLLHASRPFLWLGPAFGQRVSMNGDGLAFLYNGRLRTNAHGGFPISTAAHLVEEDEDGRKRTLLVMAGRLPHSILKVASLGLPVVAGAYRQRLAGAGLPTRAARMVRDVVRVGDGGAVDHTVMFKMTAEDSAAGRIRFASDGTSRVDWPDYLDDPVMRLAERALDRWAEKAGGSRIPDLGRLPRMPSFGVHPLGGCRMADSPDGGVVDDLGRVYRPDGATWPGLRIADASILPSALGVPSSLTIAALGERIGEALARELDAGARALS